MKKRRRRRPLPAPRRRAADHDAAQRSLDRRLQGPLPDAATASTATRSRSPTSTRASCSRATACCRRRAHGVRPVFERLVPRVRPAARDSHRQRRALRHHRHPRPLAAQRVVDAPRAFSTSASCPAHPQQNGAHERMHKTLKARGDSPARARPCAAQQRAFNRVPPAIQRRAAAPASARANARRRSIGRRRAPYPAPLPAARVSRATSS